MFSPSFLDHRHGPLNDNYLEKLEFIINNAQADHPRTFAVRADLRLSPTWFNNDMPPCNPNLSPDLMTRFIRSLMAKIESYRQRLTKQGKRAYPCTLRYYWVREIETLDYPHYHTLLFFNKDLFWQLGRFDPASQDLSAMIQQAWLSALGLHGYDEYRALVHFPDNPTYVLDRSKPDFDDHYKAFVFRASYLTKDRSKVYSASDRSIGYSQK